MMHGLPIWIVWLVEHWLAALALIVVAAIWLVGAAVCLIRGAAFKTAAVWPLSMRNSARNERRK